MERGAGTKQTRSQEPLYASRWRSPCRRSSGGTVDGTERSIPLSRSPRGGLVSVGGGWISTRLLTSLAANWECRRGAEAPSLHSEREDRRHAMGGQMRGRSRRLLVTGVGVAAVVIALVAVGHLSSGSLRAVGPPPTQPAGPRATASPVVTSIALPRRGLLSPWDGVSAIAVGRDAVWAARCEVVRVDPRSDQVVATVPSVSWSLLPSHVPQRSARPARRLASTTKRTTSPISRLPASNSRLLWSVLEMSTNRFGSGITSASRLLCSQGTMPSLAPARTSTGQRNPSTCSIEA